MASSPTVARWELSRRLGARRRDLGLDVKSIAEFLGFTRNYWSAVENDKTLIAEDKLTKAFEILEIDEPDRTELLALREASRKRGWWEGYDDVLEEEGVRLFGLEHGASDIRSFESFVIPGLLHTEAFMREIIRYDPFHSALRADRLVELRLRRQQILVGPASTPYTCILSEAALTQRWASQEVQTEQYHHVADLVERHENITVHVLPFDVYPGIIPLSSTLVLLQFSSEHLPAVAWQEALRPVGMVQKPDKQFKRIELGWERALEECLDSENSLTFIRNRANG